jgi:Leucine-rich repeat (LRR) protein
MHAYNIGNVTVVQVLNVSNASLTGQIPAAWFDTSATKAAGQALLEQLGNTSVHVAARQSNVTINGRSTHNNASSSATSSSPAMLALRGAVADPKALLGLTQLQVLQLSKNQLTGSLPSKVSLAANLTVIDLDNNALEGQLPLELAALTQLQVREAAV